MESKLTLFFHSDIKDSDHQDDAGGGDHMEDVKATPAY